MSKKPRSTKGVPEAVFQKELFAYLQRKEANPGKNVKASFDYKGTSYTFERGRGPFGSGYQIKTSAGQAAKEMTRNEQKRSIKLSDGEKMFMDDKYAAAAERNAAEGRNGSRKLEVDHVEPRSKGGLHHPYNLRLMERGKNGSKGNKQGGFGEFESLLTETKKEFDNQDLRISDSKKGISPRARIKALGIASMAPGFLGTAADAAETAARADVARKSGNPVDWLQAGISGVTTALGATGVGEVAGLPLELLNGSIDQHREGLPQIRGRNGAARASK